MTVIANVNAIIIATITLNTVGLISHNKLKWFDFDSS